MSEKTAGVVTRLWVEASRYFYESPSASPSQLSATLDDAAGEPGRLDQLDLVASWPPQLREAVGLIEALTPEGKALLPDVLRAMAEHPGDCAVLEASMGPPVSTAARVAAWAGGLSEDDFLVVANTLLRPGTDDASQHAQELGHELRSLLDGGDLDLGAGRLANARINPPRRYPKGTCPGEVAPGQKRRHEETGITWTVEGASPAGGADRWWCRRQDIGLASIISGPAVRKMPLAEDFEPSDLAGLAKREEQPSVPTKCADCVHLMQMYDTRWCETGKWWCREEQEGRTCVKEPRVWKAGKVPPRPEVGMVLLYYGTGEPLKVTGVDAADLMHLETPSGRSAGWWTWNKAWKLAEDFSIPEDA